MKKTFRLLLTATLLIAALAFCVSAAPGVVVITETAEENVAPVMEDGTAELLAISGSGTASDPFIVVTEEDLMLVSDFPDCHFKLANDIALTSTDWEPLCVLTDPFSGTFDGDGYTISNLKITTNRTSSENGLFSVNEGTIKNLNVVTCTNGLTGGAGHLGVLAGNNKGTIQNCTASGKISVNYFPSDNLSIGGLVGYNTGNIDRCHASTYIYSDTTSFSDSNYRYVGGLVGQNTSYGKISKCFYDGTMDLCGYSSSYLRPYYYAGGLVGRQYYTSSSGVAGSITDSAAVTTINNSDGYGSFNCVAGLVGWGSSSGSTVSNCYAVVSGTQLDYGLAYYNTVTNSFYDKTVSGLTDTAYGTPKSTAAMKMAMTYTNAGWDFDNTWAISEDVNDGYPHLQWMYETTYKVTYDANGGEGAPDSQRKYEDVDLVISDVVPTREGYKFLGWATSADATAAEYISGATYSENAELTLYAVWEKVYYITYNANGGEGAPETQIKDKNVDVTISISTPARVGYKFLGWATTSDASEAEYLPDDTYSLNSDLDLYAVWEKLFVITYDYSLIGVQYKEKDVDVALSDAIPYMENREFLGWATMSGADEVEYAPGATYSANADLNLYAVWKNLYVDINIGEKMASSNVRYYEIGGNQYAVTENADNLFRVVPTADMFIEIVEKEEADSSFTVSTKYYHVDYETLTYSEIGLDSYVNNVGNPSIRVTGLMGMRFMSSILTGARSEQDEFVIEEYGFIVALQSQLDAANAQLNFDFSKHVKGVAYNKADGTDIVFDSTSDEYIVFSGVLYNIPDTAYETAITSKTYTKVSIGGQSFTVYGEAASASMYEIAKSLVESDEISEETRAELEKIIVKVEGEPPVDDELDNEIEIEGDDLFD